MLRHATTMRAATDDDGSCLQLDECGVCGGTCIPDGACDCEGNVLDECGECAVRASLMVRVTAMATYSTSAVFAAATALPKVHAIATATDLMRATTATATA